MTVVVNWETRRNWWKNFDIIGGGSPRKSLEFNVNNLQLKYEILHRILIDKLLTWVKIHTFIIKLM